MDIRQLRTFVTVARLASVTKAAEVLHITQPAVSAQLRSLEEEIGVRLLSRTTTSVVLTQSGEALLAKAEHAIESFGDFVHAARAFRGQIDGRLRIGIVMLDPAVLRVGSLLGEMVAAHPGLKIDLQVGRTSWLLDALRSAEIDCAILVSNRALPNVRTLVLDRMTFRLVVPAAWADRFDGDSLDQLSALPWIRMAPRSGHRELLEAILRDTGIKPVETVEADHEQLMRSLVAAGVGVGLLREALADEACAAGEAVCFGEHACTTQLVFAWPEGRDEDPAIQAALATLRRIWTLDDAA
ncbi:LysR family transcriptional regulator [Paraburkholderia sp. J67]|uniref:LysR family transcriptional regulator n=1 Tax=Paraburkholderia sp. J67 TaxID=2805435 RepID=UPI002ABE56A8|nr:LysR family transcriptional regulator [Paraburkholderia sp. J67]